MTKRTVLFLCPHNAAKSVMAAAYFERLIKTALIFVPLQPEQSLMMQLPLRWSICCNRKD